MRYRRRVYIPPTTISIADSMSSVIRPPDPCLIAIALVVRSRAGPRFVYHYPPNPTLAESPSTAPNKYDGAQPRDEQEHEQADPDQEGKGTDSGASVDEEGVTSEEEASVVDRSERERERDRRSPSRQHSQHSHSHSHSQFHSHSHVRKKVAIQGQGAPGEKGAEDKKGEGSSLQADSFLGLGYGVWEKLLSPSPAWHKRRFEVGVNDLTFVGRPVFVRKDGTWRKRRKKRKSEKSEKKREDEEKEKSKKSVGLSGLGAGLVGDGHIPLTDTEDGGEDGGDEREDGEDEECSDEEQLTIKDGMTMFNVVFVLNAPALEYNVRVREMYDNVVKKFGKALKSEQARANYVWKEAQSILRIKEKCREESESRLYKSILYGC